MLFASLAKRISPLFLGVIGGCFTMGFIFLSRPLSPCRSLRETVSIKNELSQELGSIKNDQLQEIESVENKIFTTDVVNEQPPRDLGAALIVQGEAASFPKWQAIVASHKEFPVSLYYGSYNEPVNDKECETDPTCFTFYICLAKRIEARNKIFVLCLGG
jgi:hypothetical protein